MDHAAIKDTRNIFRLKKENEGIKDICEHEEEDYYKPVRVGNFWNNIHNEHESNGDRNITLSIEEYLNKKK